MLVDMNDHGEEQLLHFPTREKKKTNKKKTKNKKKKQWI